MKAFGRLLIAALSAAVLASGVAHAAPTTDYSDQWWASNEPGWGAAVLQQSDTLFVDLMVHGTDGRPTWFVAAAALQAGSALGHTVFLGDLYATNGSYYGAPWNAALVGARKVGTLTFDATATDTATVSYTADGVPVVKGVSRQTWSYENLGATYDTVWNMGCPPGNALDWTTSRTSILHNGNDTVTMTVTCPLCFTKFHYDLQGTYTQSGHLGRIAVDLVAPAGGSILISEVAQSSAGFTGRVTGTITIAGQTCQIQNGSIGAALR